MTERNNSGKDAGAVSEPVEAVGVNVAERLYAGLAVGHKIQGDLLSHPPGPAPQDSDEDNSLVELPTDSLVEGICDLVLKTAKGHESAIVGVGVAIPGLIRNGVVEEAPNLPQLKGAHVQDLVAAGLEVRGLKTSVTVLNDADAVAAGLASRHGKLEQQVRVWSIGTGIGYGCYPFMEGVWEGGHTVVTLDDKENFCGCGGRGHLEGIMGHRAMRLRFLDLEPDEIFAHARKGDRRCQEFVDLWHRGLAAATASQIHLEGPGRFYFTGRDIQRLDLSRLKEHLYQMVKMSPLQSYTLEVLPEDPTIAVIGAAAAAGYIHKG
jgi:predicted NBD/HSP70 family sugar kinase